MGDVLDGELPKTKDYEINRSSMESVIAKFNNAVTHALNGGGEKAKAKHKARGKMLARERIDALIDYSSPFLELSTLAGNGLYGDVPSAGIVTGIGKICGVTCVIAANDATVKGGTVRTSISGHDHILIMLIVLVFPNHCQEAPPCPRNRNAEPPPVRVSRRQRRGIPSSSRRSVS